MDPHSVNLSYVEFNKAIIESHYPITRTDAKYFAAIQMQIQFGDYDPNKHIPGFIDQNVFLPLQYRNDKVIEAEIFREHRKLVCANNLNAKYRYCQLVRSLKTYGMTFFECYIGKYSNFRKKSKKGDDHFLIGVTRLSIVKFNPKTNSIIKEWTLENLRSWSYNNGIFTLDFEEDYVTVLMEEGEALSLLISNYIDLIIKSRAELMDGAPC